MNTEHFRGATVRLSQSINLLYLWVRIQEYTATDIQGNLSGLPRESNKHFEIPTSIFHSALASISFSQIKFAC